MSNEKTEPASQATQTVAPTYAFTPTTHLNGRGGRSSLRSIRQNHPLFVLTGAIVVAGGVVAGVTQYFHSQQIEAVNSKHTIALEKAVQPLNARITKLETTNGQLLTELGSVKRTVGGETKLFDVRKLFVTPSEVKDLPSTLEFYDDLRLYAAAPSNPPWKDTRISELDFIAMIFGDQLAKQLSGFVGDAPIREKNMMLWRGQQTLKLKFRPEELDPLSQLMGLKNPDTIVLFPFVAVQRLDRALISKTMKVVAERARELDDQPQDPSRLNDELAGYERMFAGDLAGVIMTVQAAGILGAAQTYKDAVFSIQNVQKRGPLLYMKAQIEFHKVQIAGRKGVHNVRWEREIIVATLGDTVYLILTSVPTATDHRDPAAHGSVTQWLNNLRIPADV